MPRPIIIDTDPSPDDAVAFLTALASPDELEVLAITTVAGNVPVHLTSKNARKILELAHAAKLRSTRVLRRRCCAARSQRSMCTATLASMVTICRTLSHRSPQDSRLTPSSIS